MTTNPADVEKLAREMAAALRGAFPEEIRFYRPLLPYAEEIIAGRQREEARAEDPTCMEAEHGGHPTCPHQEEVLALLRSRITALEKGLGEAPTVPPEQHMAEITLEALKDLPVEEQERRIAAFERAVPPAPERMSEEEMARIIKESGDVLLLDMVDPERARLNLREDRAFRALLQCHADARELIRGVEHVIDNAVCSCHHADCAHDEMRRAFVAGLRSALQKVRR